MSKKSKATWPRKTMSFDDIFAELNEALFSYSDSYTIKDVYENDLADLQSRIHKFLVDVEMIDDEDPGSADPGFDINLDQWVHDEWLPQLQRKVAELLEMGEVPLG